MTRKVKPPKSATGEQGEERRKLILRALHDCVIEKGYANTTLTDVARVADMYPSHLLYYFDGKQSILEKYFGKVSDQLLQRIDTFKDESPERQIDLVTELFFTGQGITKSEIGFMLECFGVAVHDKALQSQKIAMDEKCKEYLTQLFEMMPNRIFPEARDAAEICYAKLIGLRTAVYFDKNISLTKARSLFHSSMRRIAGLK
jgi:AcrR family transcriptional regulator